ncbi:MAG: cysteine hydrolase family protein [Ramlibacter sp.]
MTSALLVIDVQKFLCTGQWAAFDIDRVIGNINAVAAKARAAGAPVIFIQHEDEGPLRFESEGWQLDERLDLRPEDLRVRKTTCDSFQKTQLQAQLQSHGVDRLVVCGLQSDFCVDTTVRRALGLGYPVTLVADAHSTVDNGVLAAAQIVAHHNVTLANIDSFGPKVSATPAAEVRVEA